MYPMLLVGGFRNSFSGEILATTHSPLKIYKSVYNVNSSKMLISNLFVYYFNSKCTFLKQSVYFITEIHNIFFFIY